MSRVTRDSIENIEGGNGTVHLDPLMKISRVLKRPLTDFFCLLNTLESYANIESWESVLHKTETESDKPPDMNEYIRNAHRRETDLVVREENLYPYVHDFLASKIQRKQFFPTYTMFPERSAENLLPESHDGEEFLTVLQGRLEFHWADPPTPDGTSRNGGNTVLETGDSLYLHSRRLAHCFRAVQGHGPAVTLQIIWDHCGEKGVIHDLG